MCMIYSLSILCYILSGQKGRGIFYTLSKPSFHCLQIIAKSQSKSMRIHAPRTKAVKEKFLKVGFQLTEAEKQTNQLVEMMTKMIQTLDRCIGKRKCKKLTQELSNSSLNGIMLEFNQYLRHYIKCNLAIYKELACEIRLDKIKVTQEIRRVVYIRKHERHQFQILKHQHELAFAEMKKVLGKFEDHAKEKYLYRIDEHYRHDGDAIRSDDELQILQQISKTVGLQIQKTKMQESTLKTEVDKFWTLKSRKTSDQLSCLLKIAKKIVNTKGYQEKLKKMKSQPQYLPIFDENADLDYIPTPADYYNKTDYRSSGIDLEYTDLPSDFETPQENYQGSSSDDDDQEHPAIPAHLKQIEQEQNKQAVNNYIVDFI